MRESRRSIVHRRHAFMSHSLFARYPSKLSVSADRRISKLLLHSHAKFGQVVARKIVPPRKRSVRCGLFQCKRGFRMNNSIVVKLAAAALVVALAGCTDLKPLQAEVDGLKQQVGQLQTDVDAAKASADAAARAARVAPPPAR